MKLILTPIHVATAVAALAMVACSADEDLRQGGEGTTTTIVAEIVEAAPSRSAIDPNEYLGGDVGIQWTPDDCIGVFGSSTSNSRFTNNLKTNAGKAAFTGKMNSGDRPLYAYYPYSEANDGRQANDLVGSLPLRQEYDPSTRVIGGDYKVGVPAEFADDQYTFSHLFSLFRIRVNATGTDLAQQKLDKISITVQGRTLGGDFAFDATDATKAPVFSAAAEGVDPSTVTMVYTGSDAILSPGKTCEGYISCAPTIKENDEVTIRVYSDSKVASFTRHAAYDFAANTIYTFDLNLSSFGSDLKVEDRTDAMPELKSFAFTVAANPGKILDKKVVSQNGGASVAETAVEREELKIEGREVSGMIPYLYDFTLVPEFTVPAGIKVTVGGVEQTSGESAQNFSQPVVYTLTNSEGDKAEYTVSVTNTGLPVVVVNQSSTLTTGSWVKWFGGLSVRSKDAEWVADDVVSVYNADGSVLVDAKVAGVRLRGNSTQNFPKKPFAIKFDKSQAPVEGLAKHKRWVLLANWLDCSMMRNNTAFAIAHATEAAWQSGAIEKGLAWNPHGTSVELVLDGRHVGNYYLCEQIKIDKNRLAIQDAYEDVLKDTGSATFATCGYLIECDDNYDENCRFLTAKRYLPFMLKDDVPSDILTQIKTKVNRIEANIIAGNYTAAYGELDINSLIDQWIVYELTMNNEYKHPKSVYLYMDGDSKLCAGPVWDFDYQTFPNASTISTLSSTWGGEAAPSMSEWMYAKSSPATSAQEKNESDMPYMWYPLLMKDKAFRDAVQARWAAIYPQLVAVEGQISEYAGKYAASWEVNNAMWPLNFRRSQVTGWAPAFSGDEAMTSYAQVVENLRDMYSARLTWMNNAITSGSFYTSGK